MSLAPLMRDERLGTELPAFYETGVWLTDLLGTPDKHLRYPHLPELLEVPDKRIGMISLKPQYFDIVIKAKDRMVRRGKWKLTYQLKPLEMQEFGGDTVIVHYAAEYVYDYGNGTKSGAGLWRKFTHTWMRTGNGWQMIGGMCAAQEPVKAPRG